VRHDGARTAPDRLLWHAAGRQAGYPLGWVGVQVCAVTEVWSGLKLVVRKELR